MVVIPGLSLWGRLSAEDNARVNVAMNQTRINHLAGSSVNRAFRRSAPARISGNGPGPEYARCIT